MNYEAAIFDLDGTLVNSLRDLADAVNYALRELGRPMHELEAYRYLVGQGVKNLIRDALGAGHEGLFEEGLRLFHEYYDVHMYDHTGLYPGVGEMLRELKNGGVKLGVVSNKPDGATREVVTKLLDGYGFDVVFGAREGVAIKPDPAGLREAMDVVGVKPSECVYVGDSKVDMLTGKAGGVMTVGVSWGFREVEELEQNGADVVVHDACELSRIILGK
ncbi:Phosphoglycolate phosphatase [Poriferisphaera corsica]|uniref:phosphoglycolate phosphatase n=1 Tax=Poriferisphaera corsica TaxID=2528020 RepID=A0A517YRY5_9BACT|nr:HAD-IA family hydrolase [Poriferisphaera corsica]QDU32980.1 Phosphoglycolate phosphatase [Poriferisphaera corsica]